MLQPNLPDRIRVTRGGTREEIRSFRERARAAHDYSADLRRASYEEASAEPTRTLVPVNHLL